jgi:hypothetical protein
MDYGNLLTRAGRTIWNQKFLIGLGVLAALGSGNSSGGSGNFNLPNTSRPGGAPAPGSQIPNFSQLWGEMVRQLGDQASGMIALFVALFCVALLIALALWVVGRVAEGGMINGVDEIEGDHPSSFTLAWSAGWHKGWRLLGIGLIAAIPSLLMLLILGVMFYSFFTGANGQALMSALSSDDPNRLARVLTQGGTFWVLALAVFCPFTLVSLVLSAIKAFADRACMTEDKGVFESYGRGWEVLRNNLGQAVVLFLIQIGLSIGAAIVLFLPGMLAALCCLVWPLLLVVAGGVQAYFSALWTLAWREWAGAGMAPGEPPAEPMNPATAATG